MSDATQNIDARMAELGRLAGRHARADPHAHQADRSERHRGMEVARLSRLVNTRWLSVVCGPRWDTRQPTA